MILKKILTSILIFLLLMNCVFSVKIVTSQEEKPVENNSLAKTILTIFIMILIFGIFLVIFSMIILKIYTLLTNHFREDEDFLYKIFSLDLIQCINNRDPRLIKKNWRFLWIFFKRKPVYANTQTGLKYIGNYNGEFLKKENFYGIGIVNKLSMFKNIEQIITIPLKLKDSVKKETVGSEYVIIIDCEGVDNFENTDYYLMPLILDPKNKSKFLDFSDMIHTEYIEKIVHREMIKENLLNTKDLVSKSVEANPRLNFKRRSQ